MEESIKKSCTFCGTENSNESKFCSNCGTKLEEPIVEKEIDIHYEEETIYNNNEMFNEYYSSDYQENSAKSEMSTVTEEPESYVEVATNGNIGFAIASMVCGIISLLCCCTFFGLVVGIAGVVLGIIALKGKYDGKGMAIAGIVTGSIGIFIWLCFMIIGGLGVFTELLEY